MNRLFFPLLVLAAGCVPDVSIESPAPGAMFLAGDPVPLVATTDADTLTVATVGTGHRVEGEPADGVLEQTLPAVDGLGVLVVSPDGDEDNGVTRAFLQGRLLDPQEVQRSVVTAWLTPELLDGSPGTVAGLITDMLAEVGLERYVDSPIALAVPVGTLTMMLEDVQHGAVSIALSVDAAQRLRLRADIDGVTLAYTSDHDTMPWLLDYGDPENPDVGVATLDHVTVLATVNLDFLGCRPGTTCMSDDVLRDVDVRHEGFRIEDSNCIVGGLLDLCSTVEDWLRSGIKAPLADAAAAATEHALEHLVSSLQPDLGIAFPKPIQKDLHFARAAARGDSVVLEYDGQVRAVSSVESAPGQGILHRPTELEAGRGICLGEPLVNALSFAAWDGGNLRDLPYTQDELLEWGLPEEFPWTAIESARVSALLPPVLEVRDGVVWVDVGGVVGVVDAGDFGETIVRGSATVPVSIVRTDEGVRLSVRESGARLRILGLGFDVAHDLLNRSEAGEIIQVIVPAMLEGLFEQLSRLQLPELSIPPLDPEAGSTVSADIDLDLSGVAVEGNGWCVPASLSR